jgi:phosphoglycerate kinase
METLDSANLDNKTVLVRVDFNVPIANCTVQNTERIKQSLPTIRYLMNKKCRVILCSHLGRPKGKKVPELSLMPVAIELSNLLGVMVMFAEECIGRDTKASIETMAPGDVMLLENTRFHPEEKENSPEFAKELASLADIFVLDGFAVAHRADASTLGVQAFLPSHMGLLLQEELRAINTILEQRIDPFILVLGGAKVSDKLGVIAHMSKLADKILIGGAMAFPFLMLQGKQIGASYYEEGSTELVKGLPKAKLVLPGDFLIAGSKTSNEGMPSDDIPELKLGLDIGPKTVELFSEQLSGAGTVVWNGPMGVFENRAFAKGTKAIGKAVLEARASLVGGGDTLSAIQELGLKGFTHVSTGGGALLKLLEGGELACLK